MPTLVGLPELVSPTVSTEQPVVRQESKGTLSTFLQDVLPSVAKGVQAYQNENAEYNFALGRNDELNKVQRTVGLLDSHTYNQGKEFQQLNSTQMEQDVEFNKYVDEAVKRGEDAATIWDKGREYLKTSVDSVYYSDLDPKIKEQLYDADLKRQVAYQKVIQDKIQAETERRFTFDRTNRNASLYKDLVSANTPEAMDLVASSYIQKAQIAYVDIGGLTPAEAQKAIEQDISSVARFWKTQLSDPTQYNAQVAANLKNFITKAVDAGYLPMDNAIEFQANVSSVEGNILDNNTYVLEKQVEQDIFTWDTDPTAFDMGVIQDKVNTVQASIDRGEISPEDGLRLMKRYLSYGGERQRKLANASEDMSAADMIGAGVTLQQWVGVMGNSEDSYIKNYEAAYLNQFPDTTTAGLAMFDQAIKGDPSGFTLRKLATKAGNWLSGNVLSTANMSPQDLENSTNGKQRMAQFNQLKATFQAVSKTNPDMADALLEGFPEDKREIIRDTLMRNGSVGDLKQSLDNAPEITERKKFTREAVSKLEFKDIRGGFISNLFFNNSSGVRTAWGSQQKSINDFYAAQVRQAALDSAGDLEASMTSSDPEKLMKAIKQKGILVPSENWDYSDVIMPTRATKALDNRYKFGAATPQYVVRAIDTKRAELIKSLGVEQENVMAVVDRTGQYVSFKVFDSSGEPHKQYPNGISMNLAELDKRVAKVRAESEAKKPRTKVIPQSAAAASLQGVRVPSAPIGRVTVKDAQGRSTNVQYTAAASQAFGGNTYVTKLMLDHWVQREGFVTAPVASGAPAGGGQRSVKVVGLGTNLDVHANASDGKGSTWGKRFAAASGNAQATMNVTSDFIAQHHKGLSENLRAAHIPVPTTAPYDKRYIPSVMAVADAMWLSPSTGKQMVQILNQPNLQAAMTLFTKNSAMYTKQANGQLHPRTKDFERMIRSHYNLKR